MKRIICLQIIIIISVASTTGQGTTSDYAGEGIMTVKLYREGWNLSYPIIGLGSDENLLLQFDKAGERVETYYYTFIHCDKDWNESDLFTTDYLDGFAENQIEDYQMSFNTTVNYIHYSLSFPNSYVNFNYSGNYIIRVFPVGEPDNPVIIKRFMVSESSVTINPEPQRSKLTIGYATHQQIDFTVNHPGLRIDDPYRTVSASVLQNGRWDNARQNLRPDFIRDNQLVYNDLSGKTLFPGGDEFRYFDIKSLRYQTEKVRSVEFFEGMYHVYLLPSENRWSGEYFYWQDFNGKYYTAFQEGTDPETEADYVSVYFTLPSRFPVSKGDVYVFGALSNWSTGEMNRMQYNQDEHRYELTMLLKQGWYNYIYKIADNKGRIIEEEGFENNHYETENDYLILIYLHEPTTRYDRLIGNRIINTLNR